MITLFRGSIALGKVCSWFYAYYFLFHDRSWGWYFDVLVFVEGGGGGSLLRKPAISFVLILKSWRTS